LVNLLPSRSGNAVQATISFSVNPRQWVRRSTFCSCIGAIGWYNSNICETTFVSPSGHQQGVAMKVFKRTGRRAPQRRRRRDSSPQLSLEQLEPRQLLSVNVLTWHNDLTRQGLNSAEVELTPANVNTSSFGKLFSYAVDGQIYAEPLYVSNLAIPGQGSHNVVFVATEHNDVYAFDADSNSGASAGLLWHVNLGPSAAMPNPYFGNRYGAYHDINPEVGITSTPVIDLATGTMYIDAFTNDIPGQNAYSHHIWALDIMTGQQKTTPTLVAALVQGDGAGSVGGTITFTATQQLQRPALTLLNGTLYVAYSGYADTDPYNGWVLGFDASTLQLTSVLNTTPNAGTDTYEGEGGIWQTGNGLSSDGTRLYVMTGNGDFNASVGDYSDSFLEITPDSSTQPANLNGYGLSVTDYFTPYNEQSLADADADLGSAGTMLLPDQAGAHPHLLVGAGKQGVIYVIDRDNMGQFNAGFDSVVQKVSLGHGTYSSPAYFDNKIYYHAQGDVLKAYGVTNGVLSAAPVATGSISYSGFPGSSTPSVSSNGTANGIVWDVQYNASHAVLRAYDATTLVELYDSNQNVARDQLGGGVKFVTPMIADGHVFVGTSGALAIFGLISPPTTPPAAPSDLVATALGPAQVQLNWVDNADNESGFKIEQSTDNANFSQIAVAGAGSNSYVDATASASTTYYYRVRATNVIGDSDYTPSASATTPASSSAVDLYHFDEGAGTATADSAGTNNGTRIGTTLPVWVAGKIGTGALSFSGNGTFRSMTNQSAVQLTDNLAPVLGSTATLAAWIKTTQTGNNSLYAAPAITGVEVAGTQNDIRWGYLDAAGHVGMGAGDVGVVSTTSVNDGQWHHVAFTRDANTGTVQVYVDGVLQATGSSDTGLKNSPFNLIGAQTDLTSGGGADGHTYFNGQLDELRIYDQVIGANEIAGMAIVPAAPTLESATVATGPVVHLTFTNPSNFAQNLEVYRKVGAAGTYTKIATLAASATMYDDENVAAGIEYFYVIKATDLAGSSPDSNELSVTPQVPSIVGNFIFYNGSGYDGNNGSSNVPDYLAIATDKQALMPGETASFQNYSSYAKGINGIIIDVADLEVLPRVDDFNFRVGSDSDVENWTAAPTPTYVNTYPGRGIGGSTQITLIWDDNAIQNEWLQVIMPADSHLGLAEDNVFYFGSAIGETGNSSNAFVDTGDELATRSNGTAAGGAAITNVYDFNRDKQVDSQDEMIARSHRSGLAPLQLITVPAAGSGAAAVAVAAPFASSAASSIDPVEASVETVATPSVVSVAQLHVLPDRITPVPAFRRTKSIDAALDALFPAVEPAVPLTILLTSTRYWHRTADVDRSIAGTMVDGDQPACNAVDQAADEAIVTDFGQVPMMKRQSASLIGRHLARR
jgi:Concanavalin A-like lectin/glucanases superfamily